MSRRQILSSVLLTVLLAMPLAAQQHTPATPAAAPATGVVIAPANQAPNAPDTLLPDHLFSLPQPAPRVQPAAPAGFRAERPRTADRQFWTWSAAAGAATVLDVESTVVALRQPGTAEGNSWLYGAHPSRARLYATNAPINALFTYLAYWAKKRPCTLHCGMWRFPLVALTAIHAGAGTANLVRLRGQ